MVVTSLDIQPDTVGSWGNPGVPLMEWQIGLAAILSVVFGWVMLRYLHENRANLWICLGIWVLAAALWAGHPLIPGYFATPGRLPNYEIYPFSDGATYDQYAQSLLVGGGFLAIYPSAPSVSGFSGWPTLVGRAKLSASDLPANPGAGPFPRAALLHRERIAQPDGWFYGGSSGYFPRADCYSICTFYR